MKKLRGGKVSVDGQELHGKQTLLKLLEKGQKRQEVLPGYSANEGGKAASPLPSTPPPVITPSTV